MLASCFKLSLSYGEGPIVPAAEEEVARAGKERKPRGLETKAPALHREPQHGKFGKLNSAGLDKPMVAEPLCQKIFVRFIQRVLDSIAPVSRGSMKKTLLVIKRMPGINPSI